MSHYSPKIDLPKEYPIEEVLAQVGSRTVDWDGYAIWMNSSRYRLFREKGVTCVTCGRKGDFFLIRKNRGPTKKERDAHFNLWSREPKGSLILMTQDHILPRSKGGSFHLSNLQTMCSPCNQKKGNGEKRTSLGLEGRRRPRAKIDGKWVYLPRVRKKYLEPEYRRAWREFKAAYNEGEFDPSVYDWRVEVRDIPVEDGTVPRVCITAWNGGPEPSALFAVMGGIGPEAEADAREVLEKDLGVEVRA